MNIIYLNTHDSGRFLQPYGYGLPTPNLQKFAEKGTVFRQMYCAAPTCCPSRAAMLTGMNAHSSGVTGLVHRGFALKDPKQHLANYLKSFDFETVLCGVQHETAGDPREIGYERIYVDHPYDKFDFVNIDKKSTADAVAFLKEEHKKPFMLTVGFIDTHRDYPEVEHPTNPDYVLPPAILPDCEETRRDFAHYIDSVKVVDDCCGKIFDTLTESKLWDDTLVIFTTDHGIAFPKMKCSLYDTGMGVAFMIRLPGENKQKKVIDAMISQLDVYPTICDYLGLPKPQWLEGISMKPLLEGTEEKIRDQVFAEVTYHAAYEPKRCIRTERYKFIECFDAYPYPTFCNTDDGESKSYLMEHEWKELAPEKYQLYDLVQDPTERRNLAKDLAHQEILKELKDRLYQWMKDTEDPLLAGKVEKPAGARVNKKTTLHPTDKDYEV